MIAFAAKVTPFADDVPELAQDVTDQYSPSKHFELQTWQSDHNFERVWKCLSLYIVHSRSTSYSMMSNSCFRGHSFRDISVRVTQITRYESPKRGFSRCSG